MTRKQQSKIQRAWNDRPEPVQTLIHYNWMSDFINADGTLSYAGQHYSWDYRINQWVRF
jgi:hypothetical protein